jgi:hypothetical protein
MAIGSPVSQHRLVSQLDSLNALQGSVQRRMFGGHRVDR